MAVYIIQQPGSFSFSGDPIIAKIRTSLSEKTFLRIVVQCLVKLTHSYAHNPNTEEHTYIEEYTFHVGSDGIATFNVGNTLKVAFDKYSKQDVKGLVVDQVLYSAKYQLICKEVYFNGLHEVEGTPIATEWLNCIMGALSEYERISMIDEDVSKIIGKGRMLTRKPKGELIVKGIDWYLPAILTIEDSLTCYIIQNGGAKSVSEYTGGVNIPISVKIDTSEFHLSSLDIYLNSKTDNINVEISKGRTVVAEKPDMRHFLFLNGFGLIESVTCTVRESLSYLIESQQYTIPSAIDFKGHKKYISYTQTPKVELSMSSGYVNREWAEWWVNEFLPTGKAWMLLDGKYRPVSIIPEENNKLFDRSKPGMMAVQFKVQYSFSGGTYNSFVR